jgi:hypothetical protein
MMGCPATPNSVADVPSDTTSSPGLHNTNNTHAAVTEMYKELCS